MKNTLLRACLLAALLLVALISTVACDSESPIAPSLPIESGASSVPDTATLTPNPGFSTPPASNNMSQMVNLIYHSNFPDGRTEQTVSFPVVVNSSATTISPFSCNGYTLVGFSGTPSGTSVNIHLGETLSVTAEAHLYSVWIKDSVTVNVRNPLGKDRTHVTDAGSTLASIPCGENIQGYIFRGYALQENGAPLDTAFSISNDLTLYEIFEPIAYTVSLRINDDVQTIECAHGDAIKLPTTCNIPGFEIEFWKETQTGSHYMPGESTKVEKDRSFVADLRAKALSVQIDWNGWHNAGAASELEVVYGETYSNLPTPADRAGWLHTGYSLDPEGRLPIDNDSTVTHDTDHIIYAQYSLITKRTFTWSGDNIKVSELVSNGIEIDLDGFDLNALRDAGYTAQIDVMASYNVRYTTYLWSCLSVNGTALHQTEKKGFLIKEGTTGTFCYSVDGIPVGALSYGKLAVIFRAEKNAFLDVNNMYHILPGTQITISFCN